MFQHRALRSSAFWLIAGLAFAAQAVVAAIIIRLTTARLLAGPAYHLGLAASVIVVVTLALLLLALATRRHVGKRAGLNAFYFLAMGLHLVAAALSIAFLTWVLEIDSRHGLAAAGVAFWAISLLAGFTFYGYLVWPQRNPNATSPTELLAERPSPARSAKRSLSIHLASLRPPPPPFFRAAASEPYSPTLSAFSASPRSSLRESLHQAIRPMTSKTRLLRQSLTSVDARSYRSGRPISFDTMRHDDGFETWDTSRVEETNDDTCVNNDFRKRLEPIPGSRPVSPAKPLNGPFKEPLMPEETPLPDSPMQSPPMSPANETSSLHDYPLPPLRRPSTSQSHIHPLFRPESPLPPPLPSPGTVITASPMAGQIVSPEHALGSKMLNSNHGARIGATSPLSPSGSRAGSIKSFRMQSPSPAEPLPASPLHESVTHFGG